MHRNKIQGFTLVEVILVICIFTLLGWFATLGMNFVRNAQVSKATKILLADLQRMRINAMTKDSKGYGIRFESPTAYTLFKFDDCNGNYIYNFDTCGGGTKEEARVVTRTAPSMVVLKKTNPLNDFNDDIIIFDRFGAPRTANWAFGWRTIVVKHESDAGLIKCIVVSTNRIREGRWGWDTRKGKNACIKH